MKFITVYCVEDLGVLAIEDFLRKNKIPQGKECYWRSEITPDGSQSGNIQIVIEDGDPDQ